MPTSTVTSKGQITLPRQVRQALGLLALFAELGLVEPASVASGRIAPTYVPESARSPSCRRAGSGGAAYVYVTHKCRYR
jgi:hypothetical protein